jgi:hypothetical protein
MLNGVIRRIGVSTMKLKTIMSPGFQSQSYRITYISHAPIIHGILKRRSGYRKLLLQKTRRGARGLIFGNYIPPPAALVHCFMRKTGCNFMTPSTLWTCTSCSLVALRKHRCPSRLSKLILVLIIMSLKEFRRSASPPLPFRSSLPFVTMRSILRDEITLPRLPFVVKYLNHKIFLQS